MIIDNGIQILNMIDGIIANNPHKVITNGNRLVIYFSGDYEIRDLETLGSGGAYESWIIINPKENENFKEEAKYGL